VTPSSHEIIRNKSNYPDRLCFIGAGVVRGCSVGLFLLKIRLIALRDKEVFSVRCGEYQNFLMLLFYLAVCFPCVCVRLSRINLASSLAGNTGGRGIKLLLREARNKDTQEANPG
jgi:hypothetical protein